MEGRSFTPLEFAQLQDKFLLWKTQNPKAGPTKSLEALMRLYEIHNYGITSKSLALGKEVSWIYEDGAYRRIESAVDGMFYSNPLYRGDIAECHFNRAKFKLADGEGGKRLTYKEYIKDTRMVSEERLEKLEDIKLAVTAHSTGTDTGSTKSLLESALDTGFGSSSGVIRPQFMNMLLELTALKAFMAKFVGMQPMSDMTFYFPMKTSTVDTHAQFARTVVPTAEGRAGTDYSIAYDRYEINGWKYLRHAELTDEINELVGRYLTVTSHYMDDLAAGNALLWDYPIVEGLFEMVVRGKWRRPESGSWATTTEIPFGKASVLTTEAKKSYLFQDLSQGANDGKIYEPAVATGDEFKYDSSTIRAGSTGSDELYEGIMSLASLQKVKRSELQFVILTESRQTERLVRDSRFHDTRFVTGTPKFQDEAGYLGKIAIGGSSTMTDVWEAPDGLFLKTDSDTTGEDLFPVIGGKYGTFWHQGVFTPFNMRVDRGMEVTSDGRGIGGANVLRDNETNVITTGSKGSTWPGDYHDISILWTALDDTHA